MRLIPRVQNNSSFRSVLIEKRSFDEICKLHSIILGSCTYLGNLGQFDTNVIDPISVKWLKVAKVSVVLVVIAGTFPWNFTRSFANVNTTVLFGNKYPA
jgi:hypothetical protein